MIKKLQVRYHKHFQLTGQSHQWLAGTLARICKEQAEDVHSNLQLRKMFDVRNHVTDPYNNHIDISNRTTWAMLQSKRTQYGASSESMTKTCLRKLSLPSKVFFARETCLRSLKKTCESSTRNCGPFEVHIGSCWNLLRYAHRPSKKVKYLRQSATVTAFGHPVYDGLVANIAIIHSIFRRAVGDHLIERRAVGDHLIEEGINSMFEEWPAIDVANRYFTPKAVACLEDIWPIGIDVDPFSSLNRAASSLFMHTEENKVYYFQRKESTNGDMVWVTWKHIHPNILDWHIKIPSYRTTADSKQRHC